MKNCNTCKHTDTEKCLECFTGEEYEKRVVTNYDRIRNMGVEEMAEFLGDVYKQGYIDNLNDEPCIENKDIKLYLESEVEGE